MTATYKTAPGAKITLFANMLSMHTHSASILLVAILVLGLMILDVG